MPSHKIGVCMHRDRSKSSNILNASVPRCTSDFDGMLFMQTMHKFKSFFFSRQFLYSLLFVELLKSQKLYTMFVLRSCSVRALYSSLRFALIRCVISQATSKTDETISIVFGENRYRTAAVCIARPKKTFSNYIKK